ncbi:MAG: prephenate dehydrogenase [bacterium]
MKYVFNRVGIIGVGLLGGSLGLALKQRKIARSVVGFGRNESRLIRAKKKKAIDAFYLPEDWQCGLHDVEIVVVCTPVRDIVPFIRRIVPWLPKGSIITDVGSTKESIVNQIDIFLKKQSNTVSFIGSHPMAGSEQTGIEFAKSDLFKQAVCLITPSKYTEKSAINKVSRMWKMVGGNIIYLSPADHDRYVAAISHLPHIIAANLVDTVAALNKKDNLLFHLAAGGFKDTTRIASSSPDLWRDICLENKKSIIDVVQLFEKELKAIKQAISASEAKQIHKVFNTAKQFRDQIK